MMQKSGGGFKPWSFLLLAVSLTPMRYPSGRLRKQIPLHVQIQFHFRLRDNRSAVRKKPQCAFRDVLFAANLHLGAGGFTSCKQNQWAKRVLRLNIGWKPCALDVAGSRVLRIGQLTHPRMHLGPYDIIGISFGDEYGFDLVFQNGLA